MGKDEPSEMRRKDVPSAIVAVSRASVRQPEGTFDGFTHYSLHHTAQWSADFEQAMSMD
jgi:hypothetical protein